MILPQALERHEVWSMVGSAITGGGLIRGLHYVAKAMPPLPPNAGWWKTFAYQLVNGATGHDPASNPVIPPNGAKEN